MQLSEEFTEHHDINPIFDINTLKELLLDFQMSRERGSYFSQEARKLEEEPRYKEALYSPSLTLDSGCRKLQGEDEPRFRLSVGHIAERKSFLAMCLV